MEGSDDGVTLDLEGGEAAVGGLVEHGREEGDKRFREARKVDVGEVVGAEFVPRGTVVGEDDVDGSFEDDKAETVGMRDELAIAHRQRTSEELAHLKTSASLP